MSRRAGYWGSYLLYGPPGGGKSDLGVSAFWDVVRRHFVARGKWVTFGREDNPFLHVPESARQTASGASLRFTVPNLDDRVWLNNFDKFTRALLDQAKRAWPLDVLFIDGLSELDLLFESTFQGTEKGNRYAKWFALMDEFFAIVQRLDPNELGCHVIMTARARERRRGTDAEEDARDKTGDDFQPFDYYPALRGGFKDMLGHYFNNIFYVHTRRARVKQAPPQHVIQVVTQGDYLTKLQGERDWIAAGYPREFVNVGFYEIHHRLEDILGYPHSFPQEVKEAALAVDPQNAAPKNDEAGEVKNE